MGFDFREAGLRAGTGPKLVKGEMVIVHCTGYSSPIRIIP